MGKGTKMKVYQLLSDSKNYSFFLEQDKNVDNTFFKKYWECKSFDLTTYEPVVFKLHPGDNRLKNYKMDLSSFDSGLIIFSEKAIEVLKDILEKYGQIVPIITDSKRKKFFGFYANKNTFDDSIINLNKSDFGQYEKGKVFRRVVLNNNYPKEDYIFTLADYPMCCFVTTKFKNLVKKHDLKGFDFSDHHEVLVED